jgi:hypothetical protein
MSELAKLLTRIKNIDYGFLTNENLDKLVELNRLNPVLVRCGNGRFTCAAQDVRHFTDIIKREGSDYVRDVSIPAFNKYNR